MGGRQQLALLLNRPFPAPCPCIAGASCSRGELVGAPQHGCSRRHTVWSLDWRSQLMALSGQGRRRACAQQATQGGRSQREGSGACRRAARVSRRRVPCNYGRRVEARMWTGQIRECLLGWAVSQRLTCIRSRTRYFLN
jgi:hypothetical protein